MEPLEIFLIIIGQIIVVLIALIPFFRKTYFVGPELTIELTLEGGTSRGGGLSSKNDKSNPIQVDEAIYIFNVEWKINMRIINNSPLTAYYPEIDIVNDKIGLIFLDKLNKNIPIEPNGQITLKTIYQLSEECKAKNKTHIGRELPHQLKDIEILLTYKNPSKTTFYTLFNNGKEEKNCYLRRKPKELKK